MSKDRVRTGAIQKSLTKTTVKEKALNLEKSKQQSKEFVKIREAVFSLSPIQLDRYLSYDASFEIDNDLPEEDKDESGEDTIDLNTDNDVFDEDVDDYDAIGDDRTSPLSLEGPFGEKPSIVFNPGAFYSFLVVPSQEGPCKCIFEPPSFFDRKLPSQYREYVKTLRNFLYAIASFLEQNKQEFLLNPSARNFVKNEQEFAFEPIVLQDGFLSRINKDLLGQLNIDKSAFSRLLNNLWFVWPEWTLPLKSIFSNEFKRAWLKEICADIYKNAEKEFLCPEMVYPDFGAGDLTRVKSQTMNSKKQIIGESFSQLDPEEKLHLLRDQVGIDFQACREVRGEVMADIATLDRGQND